MNSPRTGKAGLNYYMDSISETINSMDNASDLAQIMIQVHG